MSMDRTVGIHDIRAIRGEWIVSVIVNDRYSVPSAGSVLKNWSALFF
jgi:hypothetical protein